MLYIYYFIDTATCYNALRHAAMYCNTLQALQHTAMHSSTPPPRTQKRLRKPNNLPSSLQTMLYIYTTSQTPQHTAMHCGTLQCTAAHCNALRHTAMRCSTLQCTLATRRRKCGSDWERATTCPRGPAHIYHDTATNMRWLRLVGSLKIQASFAKKPCKSDYILQKRPIFWRSLLIIGTP